MKEYTHNVLSQNAFWIVNKKLAKILGSNDCALLLSDLLSKESYFGDNLEDGYFFNTRQNIEEDTNISPDRQRKFIEVLKSFNLLETKEMGLPKKTYYKINHENIAKLLSQEVVKPDNKTQQDTATSGGKIQPLVVVKHCINNNKYNNNKIINIGELHSPEIKLKKPILKVNPETAGITQIIKAYEEVNKNNSTFYGNSTQRKACQFLIDTYGLQETLDMITIIKENITKIFNAPITPKQLQDNWARIIINEAYKKNKLKEDILIQNAKQIAKQPKAVF